MKRVLSVFLCTAIVCALTGCRPDVPSADGTSNTDTKTLDTEISRNTDNIEDADTEKPSEAVITAKDSDMFTNKDSKTDYNSKNAVKLSLNGDSASSSARSVKIDGSTVTITEEADYIITGELRGMLIVDAPETAKVRLILDGAAIQSTSSAALYVKSADKVFVTLVGENSLTGADGFTAIDENNIDAAVFSRQDITFNGDGSLTVACGGGHGIVSKDDLVFTGGSYSITSASHAIGANDSVRIKNASITADSGKDGIHAENADDPEKGFVYISSGSLNIECEGDGISAGAYMYIADGDISILAGGGYKNGTKQSSSGWGGFGGMPGGGMPGGRPRDGKSGEGNTNTAAQDDSASMKGLKSANTMLLEGGRFTIDSADDAIHSDMSVTIDGGEYELASGDDAIHAEERLTVNGGKINITNSYEGLEALHIDVNGGDIKLIATDDGLNAAGGNDQSGTGGGRDGMFGGGRPGGFGGMSANSNGSVLISGGTLYINSSGDGIDANGTLEISGGHTTIVGPTTGDTATLDYDKTASITGGTFIGSGSSMMAQSFSDSSQGVIAVSVGSQAKGTSITVKDKNGNEILSYSPELAFQVFIFSSPEVISDATYTITVGTSSGDIKAS